jgi:hypothetical protein
MAAIPRMFATWQASLEAGRAQGMAPESIERSVGKMRRIVDHRPR